MIKNLVLAGAQLKGVCYIGILKALEELNLLKDIKNVLGISSGSRTCYMFRQVQNH